MGLGHGVGRAHRWRLGQQSPRPIKNLSTRASTSFDRCFRPRERERERVLNFERLRFWRGCFFNVSRFSSPFLPLDAITSSRVKGDLQTGFIANISPIIIPLLFLRIPSLLLFFVSIFFWRMNRFKRDVLFLFFRFRIFNWLFCKSDKVERELGILKVSTRSILFGN